jgi:hypothetical protein
MRKKNNLWGYHEGVRTLDRLKMRGVNAEERMKRGILGRYDPVVSQAPQQE